MSSLLIEKATIVTPTETWQGASVFIQRGKIRQVAVGKPRGTAGLPERPDRTITASGKFVVPGYIDLQVNGGKGEGFSESAGEKYEEIVRFFAEHGTTTMLATVLTDTPQGMLDTIRRVAAFRRSKANFGGIVAGIHVEGPFLNPQRRGAHPARLLRKPDTKEVRKWLRAAPGEMKMMTLAPELDHAGNVISLLKSEGIVSAVSHSCADYKCMVASVKKGLSFVTHVGNTTDWPYRKEQEAGWLGVEPGVVGSFLSMDELSGSVILDGFHFHPAMLMPVVNCKGTQKVALITDAAFVAGLAPGTYRKGRERVMVTEAGYTVGTRKGWLAGSVLTMDRAVKNAVRLAGLSLPEAVTMATLTPATVLGLEKRKGRIARGWDADVLILDSELNVECTIRGGRVVAERIRQKRK
jgi:N-acetylglucosamine-6-phosphate deacetylase